MVLSIISLLGIGCAKKAVVDTKTAASSLFSAPSREHARMLEQAPQEDSGVSDSCKGAGTDVGKSHKDRAREHEARLFDIPVPINALLLNEYVQENQNSALYYTCPQETVANLVAFYRDEMERFGWEQQALFEDKETLILFHKPHRFCVVILRPCLQKRKEVVELSLYVGL